MDNPDCNKHGALPRIFKRVKKITNDITNLQPEQHTVEGMEREEPQKKKKRVHKQKLAKLLRN